MRAVRPMLTDFLRSFNTSAVCSAWEGGGSQRPYKFIKQNDKVYEPQEADEPRRPAFVCHQKVNFKYSPDKMWYVANLVRGMTVDEAVKQLSFVNKKGAAFAKEAILEAKEMAVKEHDVEFGTDLWVADSFVGKGKVLKGIRRHAKARVGEVRYKYCHYFVRLEEGKPPLHYYPYRRPLAPPEQLDKWLQQMRSRKITGSL